MATTVLAFTNRWRRSGVNSPTGTPWRVTTKLSPRSNPLMTSPLSFLSCRWVMSRAMETNVSTRCYERSVTAPTLMRGMTISRPIKGVAIVGLLEPQATFTSLSSTHADQSDQVGETTSMPACDAAEQRRSSYATRAVRLVFTDKALAKWIASRLRSSVGARDAAFSMTARSTGSRSMPLSNRLAPSTEPSSTRRQVRRSSTVDKSLLTLGTSSLADSHSTKAALSVSSNTSLTNADVSK